MNISNYLFQNILQKLMIFVDLSTWHHKYSSFTAAIAYMYTCELILHELTHLYRSQHLFPFRFTFKFYNVECMLHSLFSFHRISIESANKDKNGRDLFANNKHIAYSQRWRMFCLQFKSALRIFRWNDTKVYPSKWFIHIYLYTA